MTGCGGASADAASCPSAKRVQTLAISIKAARASSLEKVCNSRKQSRAKRRYSVARSFGKRRPLLALDTILKSGTPRRLLDVGTGPLTTTGYQLHASWQSSWHVYLLIGAYVV